MKTITIEEQADGKFLYTETVDGEVTVQKTFSDMVHDEHSDPMGWDVVTVELSVKREVGHLKLVA